jgi:hypothetical protein
MIVYFKLDNVSREEVKKTFSTWQKNVIFILDLKIFNPPCNKEVSCLKSLYPFCIPTTRR